MKPRYDDIHALRVTVDWYDENGTPRFAPFEPAMCAKVEARQAAHLQVVCPHCRRQCDVAVSSDNLDLDIMSDLVARDAGGLYGLLPHFPHCGRPARAVLLGVHSVWRRDNPVVWRKVFPKE